MNKKIWQTARREFDYSAKTLVMGILNVTPDSFSDGGKFSDVDAALSQAEKMIADGADIIDIGGESTRPNAAQISTDEEIRRVIPVIEAISKKFDAPISIDTTKSEVARIAVECGAEIINDISGLRFDARIGKIAADAKTGLILMHSRGDFATMHTQKPVEQVLPEVIGGLRASVDLALQEGVESSRIALDIGVGFGKTQSQNLQLLAQLDEICHNLNDFPFLVGTSRKSFIGKLLNDAPPEQRINGTLASVAIAIFNGANIVRVHDVRETAEAAKIADELRKHKIAAVED